MSLGLPTSEDKNSDIKQMSTKNLEIFEIMNSMYFLQKKKEY